MTEVRIRHEYDPAAVSLGDVPFFDTEKVINHLHRWGIRFKGEDVEDTSNLSAEFVIDGLAAYFEVVVMNSD